MKSEGSVETPQDIVEEYNGCSVPQYTRYGRDRHLMVGHTEDIEPEMYRIGSWRFVGV